jgi:cytochrome oxidase Cu insertion factor (SCO1/SenC/PrrC family)
MKKLFFTFIGVCIVFTALAQTDTSQKYFKFPTIPKFSIVKIPDSSSFTNSQLLKNKPTVLFFFNPDCEHCQEETKKLTAKIDQLKDVQILMISILDFNSIKKFYNEYKIADYPNITMARETTYNLPGFYNIHTIPDIYVYDKKGNFINTFKKSFPVKEIAALF